MSDDYSKKIEKYFNNEFSEAERAAFDKELTEDAKLAKSFSQRKQMEDFLTVRPGREQLKAEIADLGDTFFADDSAPTAKRISLGRRFYWIAGAAAAAVILILLVPTWFNAPPNYQQFAEHRPLALQERGTSQEDLTAIETAFNTAEYGTALELLDQYLATQADDTQAQIYASIAALELDQVQDAIARLTPISNGQSIYQSTAQWYLALAYLKQENYAQCRSVLANIPTDNYWYPKAEQLLKKLPQE